jgi:cyclic-di-AMP phosphodiesterase PgpH
MTLAVGLLTEQRWSMIGLDAGRRLCMGLLAGIVLSGILPFLERIFGITTDISLLELADVSHPLLQELLRRAPGTYTHSMTVATLAETAAEAIGANPLLTRVGACFHDIGKMLKPHYFVENQTGENRHEGLGPTMSTLIIIGHVKDGVELGRQQRLPACVIDFIQQHHGTTLVEYFYREATRSLDGEAPGGELEASFRYPGPKPQSREIGVLMLADAVESASRALVEPAPSTLKKLVHDILFKRLLDGQFDESGLTLSELKTVEDSLCKNLIALYHARIKYPDAKTAAG